MTQEIYFDFIPVGTYLTSGIWKIHLQENESGRVTITCGSPEETS